MIAAVIAACSYIFPAHAKQAQLLLYPTRLVLENNESTATLGLKNSGDGTGAYRIELIEMAMKEEGNTVEVKDEEAQFSAKRLLRISPRSITLEPGQDQNIRIMIRKPRTLEDGEYRSHLKVSMIEDNVGGDMGGPQAGKGVGIQVKTRLALVIPIIIRHGKMDYSVKITDAKFHYDLGESGQKVPYVDISFLRAGNRSSMGDLDITYTDPQNNKHLVKHLAGIPVYRPTERRKITVPLDVPEGITIGKGSLHISYKAQEAENSEMIAESDFPL